jgi:antibiotic biosynthesis monooxygenase (ABM) superfamily enzyme
MSVHAVLIATANVRPGSESAFSAWQARHSVLISKFPGFISSDMIPPASGKPGDQWTIILNFESENSLEAWLKSPERGQILGEVVPLLEGGDFGETIKTNASGEAPGANVTEVIFSKIRPGMADRYRAWVERIQTAQAKYPGYRGMYLQPPPAGKEDRHWTTILRYDTAAHLEAWMNAPERRELLAESKAFIESEELMRLATAFPGWVPIDPMTGKGPPNWKTAMLVLLGLFPVVMLELKFLSPNLSALGIHASLGTFIGNSISVAVTSFFTMPWCVRWFGWWLFPEQGLEKRLTTNGLAILSLLYAVEIVALWRLLPW